MHDDEIQSDPGLVRSLVAALDPEWSRLPITVGSDEGTENRIFRLGDALAVRLPRAPHAVPRLEKEHEWLPRLAPHLSLPAPVPVVVGRAGPEFPWPWSVRPWLEGERALPDRVHDHALAGRDLAVWISALRALPAPPELAPGDHNSWRGEPLVERDAVFRECLAQLEGDLDTGAALQLWERACAAEPHAGPGAWIHGDLGPRNLLARSGRIHAVIDFGLLGVGDPACDLIVAWNLLDAEGRGVLREELRVDEAAWLRGQGWALSVAVIAWPYYRGSNPALVEEARRVVAALLSGS